MPGLWLAPLDDLVLARGCRATASAMAKVVECVGLFDRASFIDRNSTTVSAFEQRLPAVVCYYSVANVACPAIRARQEQHENGMLAKGQESLEKRAPDLSQERLLQ